MTTDRAALVERVAAAIRAEVRRMLENPPCEYEALATAAIDLIRAEALEEAAVVFDRYEDDPFTAAVVADHLRRMKGDSHDR